MADKSIRIITKQTAVSGRIPTGTTENETNFIKQGEMAQNTADKKLFGFDGANVFEYGSNTFFSKTGGTISGGITANTISATTYQNLPIDIRVTGGTYASGTTIFKNNIGDTFSVSGYYTGFTGGTVTGPTIFTGGLTANTISATTYNNLPPDVYVTSGNYLNGVTHFNYSNEGSFDVIGTSTYSAGIISSEDWKDNHNGTIILPKLKVALFNNAHNIEPILVYQLGQATTGGELRDLVDNDTNYIVINYNLGNPKYEIYDNIDIVDNSSIVLYLIIYRADTYLHILEFGNQGAGLPNKLNNRVIMTERFKRESGLGLTLGLGGVIIIEEGVAWDGSYRQVLKSVESDVATFFQNYHVGGLWVYSTTQTTLNNLYYDNGVDVVDATPTKYLTNWYYRGQEADDHMYEVFGNTEYDNVALAELATEPILPELISSHAFLVGRIIVQVGETTGLTQSAFINVFHPSEVTQHSDLGGLQGGAGGEYYHLTADQHNNQLFGNIENVFVSGQTFSGGLTATTISATTYQNLPNQNWTNGIGSYSIKALNDSPIDAKGNYAVAEGYGTIAYGDWSHAEGGFSEANQNYSHAEGQFAKANADTSHAEGVNTTADGAYSHVEGDSSVASGQTSHAQGYKSVAGGNYSHAQNYKAQALGLYSHAGGYSSIAIGDVSFVHGVSNLVTGTNSAVLGGSGILGDQSNSTYVPFLYVMSANTNNLLTDVLVRNATGGVELRSVGTLIFTGGTVIGSTNFTNGLTSNTISATTIRSSSTIIGADTQSLTNPERLLVNDDGLGATGFSNTIIGKANVNNYAQLNIQNINSGSNASSDVVATANNGSETSNFIDMGINSSTFNGTVGVANDAYLYSTGNNLIIANATSGKTISFLTDGVASANTRMSIASGGTYFTNVSTGNTTNQRQARIWQDTSYMDFGSYTADKTRPAIYLNQATPGSTNHAISASATGAITYINGTQSVNLSVGTTDKLSAGGNINAHTNDTHTFGTLAKTSGAQTLFTLTPGANVGQTASTEIPNFKIASATKTWATGAIPTQRWNYMAAQTAIFSGASVITDSYGLFVEAASAGTNTTITNNYAIGTNGNVSINGSVSATTYLNLPAFNSPYQLVRQAFGSATAAVVAGNYFLTVGSGAIFSGGTANATIPAVVYLQSSDYPTVNGFAPKFKIKAGAFANHTAPGTNFNFGLYPVTPNVSSGGAGVKSWSAGTVVAGSQVLVTVGADSHAMVNGSDFALPAIGWYVIGVITTATTATSSYTELSADLQFHNA